LGDFCTVTTGRHPPERRAADLSAHELYSKASRMLRTRPPQLHPFG
jgi:hypothetical protein